MRGSARIYDITMAQFVLKIEKLSNIVGPRASQDLRSPSLIIAPGSPSIFDINQEQIKTDTQGRQDVLAINLSNNRRSLHSYRYYLRVASQNLTSLFLNICDVPTKRLTYFANMLVDSAELPSGSRYHIFFLGFFRDMP